MSPATDTERLRQRVALASAIHQIAVDFLLGHLPVEHYRRRLRGLIERYRADCPN